MSRWSLDGKRVLVTGSTKGIGLCIAREVLTLGAACVMIVSRNHAEVVQVCAACWKSRFRYAPPLRLILEDSSGNPGGR
jgi:NAD(P)-dependent dehydrogenase (short-subunit alcohol dehydrogenase family)